MSICWDKFKVKFNQYLKTKDMIHLQMNPLIDIYSKLFRTYFNKKECLKGVILNDLELITNKVQSDTEDFLYFLQVKLPRNRTLEHKDSVTVNKYVEEFPGMVHFIYIDRSRQSVTLPTLDFGSEDTLKLTKEKVCTNQRLSWPGENFTYRTMFPLDLVDGEVWKGTSSARPFFCSLER